MKSLKSIQTATELLHVHNRAVLFGYFSSRLVVDYRVD